MSGTGKRKLTVGSLFAGIGGFDLGLERTVCFETRWFCELDPFCQRVLAKHWPATPCHGDITALRADDVAPVDVLCGGFPCQDISLAGRGAGLGGARSGLWSEYARLVRELRPRYVVVENVPALRKRGLEVVLADLMACGYDAEWDGIPAAAVGAPHRRDRLWIVAYPSGSRREPRLADLHAREPDAARCGPDVAHPHGERELQQGGAECSFGRRPSRGQRQGGSTESPGHGAASPVADSDRAARDAARSSGEALPRPEAVERSGRCGGGARQDWTTEPDVGRVAHGVPARVDRLRGLGNALVPQIAEWIGYRIAEHEGLI